MQCLTVEQNLQTWVAARGALHRFSGLLQTRGASIGPSLYPRMETSSPQSVGTLTAKLSAEITSPRPREGSRIDLETGMYCSSFWTLLWLCWGPRDFKILSKKELTFKSSGSMSTPQRPHRPVLQGRAPADDVGIRGADDVGVKVHSGLLLLWMPKWRSTLHISLTIGNQDRIRLENGFRWDADSAGPWQGRQRNCRGMLSTCPHFEGYTARLELTAQTAIPTAHEWQVRIMSCSTSAQRVLKNLQAMKNQSLQ